MGQVLFSIVIPTYNRFEETMKVIQSLKNQTNQSFEIIVVDDRSTNGAYEKLENTLSLETNLSIKLIKNELEKGASGARNFGLRFANADWIAFHDSDDLWEPSKLMKVSQAIIASPAVSFFYSAYRISDGLASKELIRKGSVQLTELDFLTGNPIGGFSVPVIKSEAIKMVGGLDPNLRSRQDIDLYFRMFPFVKFEYIPTILVTIYAEGKDRISANYTSKLFGTLGFLEKHSNALKKYPGALCVNYLNALKYASKGKHWGYALRYFPILFITIFVMPKRTYSIIKNVLNFSLKKV